MQISTKPSDERKPREKGPAPPPPPAAKEVRPPVEPSPQPKPEVAGNVKDVTDSNKHSQVSVPPEESESKKHKDLKIKEDTQSPHEVVPIPPAPIAPVTPSLASEPREADVPVSHGIGDAILPSNAALFPVVPSDVNSHNVDSQGASGELAVMFSSSTGFSLGYYSSLFVSINCILFFLEILFQKCLSLLSLKFQCNYLKATNPLSQLILILKQRIQVHLHHQEECHK